MHPPVLARYPALRRVRVRSRRARVCSGKAAARQQRSRDGCADQQFLLHNAILWVVTVFVKLKRKIYFGVTEYRGSCPGRLTSRFAMSASGLAHEGHFPALLDVRVVHAGHNVPQEAPDAFAGAILHAHRNS
jgi:hypothetical protein